MPPCSNKESGPAEAPSENDSQMDYRAVSGAHAQATLQQHARQLPGTLCSEKPGIVDGRGQPDEAAAHSSTSEQLALQSHAGQEDAQQACAVHHAAAFEGAATMQLVRSNGARQMPASSSNQCAPWGHKAQAGVSGHTRALGYHAANGTAAATVSSTQQTALNSRMTHSADRAATAILADGVMHSSQNGKADAAVHARADSQKVGLGMVPELAGDGFPDPFSPGLGSGSLPSAKHMAKPRPHSKAGHGPAPAALGLKRPAGVSKHKQPQKAAAVKPLGQSMPSHPDASAAAHAPAINSCDAHAGDAAGTASRHMQSRSWNSSSTITVSPTAVRSSQGSGQQVADTDIHGQLGAGNHSVMPCTMTCESRPEAATANDSAAAAAAGAARAGSQAGAGAAQCQAQASQGTSFKGIAKVAGWWVASIMDPRTKQMRYGPSTLHCHVQ